VIIRETNALMFEGLRRLFTPVFLSFLSGLRISDTASIPSAATSAQKWGAWQSGEPEFSPKSFSARISPGPCWLARFRTLSSASRKGRSRSVSRCSGLGGGSARHATPRQACGRLVGGLGCVGGDRVFGGRAVASVVRERVPERLLQTVYHKLQVRSIQGCCGFR
jgi:hypothetical protein